MKALKIYEVVAHDDVLTAQKRPERLRFLNFLYTLSEEKLPFEHFNLIDHPLAFMKDKEVAGVLDEKGDDGFPLIYVDDVLKWQAQYPDIADLAKALDVGDLLCHLRTLPDDYFESKCRPEGCAGCSGCGS